MAQGTHAYLRFQSTKSDYCIFNLYFKVWVSRKVFSMRLRKSFGIHVYKRSENALRRKLRIVSIVVMMRDIIHHQQEPTEFPRLLRLQVRSVDLQKPSLVEKNLRQIVRHHSPQLPVRIAKRRTKRAKRLQSLQLTCVRRQSLKWQNWDYLDLGLNWR